MNKGESIIKERVKGKVTEKMKRAMAEMVGNSRVSTRKALMAAGYSPGVYNQPQKVLATAGWAELASEYLPERNLLEVAKAGLTATKQAAHIVGRDSKGNPEYDYIEEVDYYARHQYLQTGLKIRNLVSETPLGGDVVINMTNYYDTPTPPPPTPINIEIKAKRVENKPTPKPPIPQATPTPLKT